MAIMMQEREIKSRVAEGYIHVRAIIEVIGKPASYVKEVIEKHIEKIKDDEGVLMVKEDIVPPKDHDTMFSIFAELELLMKDTSALFGFCFDHMPSSVEILAPERIVYMCNDMTDFLNDLQARLHSLNMIAQDHKQKNINLIRNSSAILQNFIQRELREKKNIEELVKITGIRKDELFNILSGMVNQGKIIKDKDSYKIK